MRYHSTIEACKFDFPSSHPHNSSIRLHLLGIYQKEEKRKESVEGGETSGKLSSSFNIYNLIHFHRRENLCCISFARSSTHTFSTTMEKSPFCAYGSALNSQPRLFIYFIFPSLFFPSPRNPRHNLTNIEKKERMRRIRRKQSTSRHPRHQSESLFLYLSIISFDEAKCVRHGKFVLCVMKMPKPLSPPTPSSSCCIVEERKLLMSLGGGNCLT